MTRTRIVILAKAPVPGRVKTRLIPALGEVGAARLAHKMLLNTVAEAVAANLAMPCSSSLTQCACHTSSPSQPRLSAYSVGVLLNFSRE